MSGPWSWRVTLIMVRAAPPLLRWTLSPAVTSEQRFSQRKDEADPELERGKQEMDQGYE